MFLLKTTSTLPLLVVLAVLVSGCGGRKNQELDADPNTVELKDIYRVFRIYIKRYQRAPTTLSDFKEYQAMFPIALQLLRDGKYIPVWGVKDRDAGTILAYEKDAPTNGGRALMADGTVKHLDASAFQNIPKPGK